MQRTLAVIDLRAIERNALKIKAMSKSGKFYAVVKADAYGHGAEEVARRLESIADGFCVAIIEEGVALRQAGILKPILVFTPPQNAAEVYRSAYYDLTVTVNSVRTAKLCKGIPCHIKVNTGMNRCGADISVIPKILKNLNSQDIKGVYSHLYAPSNGAASAEQLKIFNRAESVVKAVSPHICAHIAASGGILRGKQYLKDGVRCGILLYGYAPSGFCARGFKPAMKVYANRMQRTQFIGGGIGYNYAEKQYGSLSVYRLGYADGFRRTVPLGEKTLCMDSFIRDGGGKRVCVMSDAEEYAERCGTISYEVLTSVITRAERVYIR